MRRALACLGAIGLVWWGAGEAHARSADFSVSLDYVAPAGCPDAAALEALVSARLGYDPFAETAADRLAVHITPRGSALEGQIEWHDASGKWVGDQAFRVGRTECRGLTRTIALALAVQIQLLADANAASHDTHAAPDPAQARADGTLPPSASPAPTEPPAEPRPQPAPAPAAPSAPENDQDAPPKQHSEQRRAGPAFAMGAGTSVALGMSSGPVLLGRAFGALGGEHWSVELGAEASLPAITRRADGAGVVQQALFGTAAGCAALRPWFLCLVASAGEIKMAGKDVDRPNSAVAPMFDAGLRIGVTQPITRRFFISAHLAALLHVVRWTPRLDEVPVWQAPALAAAGGIDFGVTLF